MDIEKTLKEVAGYFKDKLFEGEFKFLECGGCTARILIDDKYEFDLWIANEPKNNFDFYEGSLALINAGEFIKLKTQKERLKGWRQIKPFVNAYRNDVLKKDKLKKLDELKKEIEKLS